MLFSVSVDGVWNNWSNWTECTLTCGKGSQERNRTCDGPYYDGANCTGEPHETRECNTNPCPSEYFLSYSMFAILRLCSRIHLLLFGWFLICFYNIFIIAAYLRVFAFLFYLNMKVVDILWTFINASLNDYKFIARYEKGCSVCFYLSVVWSIIACGVIVSATF